MGNGFAVVDDTRWGTVRIVNLGSIQREYTLFAGVYGGFEDGSTGKW